VAGTPSDVLAETLREHYGGRGLTATLRYFKTIAELKQAGLSIAVIKFDFLEDHYVTILSVTDREVVAGDPLNGLVTYSYDDFAKVWRYSGVVLGRPR
jgi:predicted double-glycine peptidase